MKTWNYLTHEDVNELLELIQDQDIGTHAIVDFVEDRMVKLNAHLLEAANYTKDDLGEVE